MLNSLERYFNTIKENSFTEYSELDATNVAEAKAKFFEDPALRVPKFRYDRTEQSLEYLQGILSNLSKIRSEILRDAKLKSNEKKLLNQLIQASHRTATLLLSISEYRAGINPDLNALKFACCNKGEYGEPDRRTTLSLLSYELNQLKTNSFTDEEQQIYQRLLINLPSLEAATTEYFVPHPKTMTKFGKLFRQYFPAFFEALPEGKTEFTPEEVAEIAEYVLGHLRSWSGTNFRVEISDTKSNFSVDQLKRVMYIPRHRTLGPYTHEIVKTKFCAHEFVHLFRGVPFEACGVPALSYGFPGYDEAEEGVTTACEYAIRGGKYVPQNADRYVNIGLLYHFAKDGYDFRKVFEIRRDLTYLSKVDPRSNPETKAKCLEQVMDQTFTEISRATRGSGILPYHKDLIYFNGNQKILRHIESVINSGDDDAIAQMINDFFWSGKTDPLNRQHMNIVQAAIRGEFGGTIRIPEGKFRDIPM